MRCPSCIIAMIAGVVIVLVAASAAGAPSKTAQATSRPTTAVEAKHCVTSDCHANIRASRVVHGPVAVDACDACHELTDAAKHTFKASRDKAELCTYCHEFSVQGLPVVHKPVTLGECLGCHDPHGGTSHSLTRENTTAELCGRCHESVTRGKAFLHGPVAKDACLSCHPPHAARFSKLLDVVGPDLCLTCHSDFEGRMARVKFTHRALDEGCQKCHDPHGSASPNSTTQPVAQQCTGCHAQVAQRAAGAKVKHSIVASGRSCMNCHTPHGSDVAKLISDVPANVCLKCHDEPIKTDQEGTVAAVREFGDPHLFKHGALGEGQCSGCHQAHGSDGAMLLSKTNSLAFYQRFSLQQYELCLSCHDRRLVTEEKLAGITNFRDGERNLHYLHVATGKRSHSCRACHDPHVGTNPKLLRGKIDYGIWQLPLKFRQTDTGGTCTPGCHVAFSYDRVNPVGPSTRSISPEMPLTARVDERVPEKVKFILKDLTEEESVVVPDADRASLVVFLADDSAVNNELLWHVNVCLRKAAAVRVVLVACGRKASAIARELDERSPVQGAAIVVDEGGKLCEQLKVHGRPTTLLIRADGTVMVRTGGTPELLAMKLLQYLAQPADAFVVETVTDGRRTGASRDFQIARDLLNQGRPQEVVKLLTPAIEAEPKSTALKVLLIEALADLKQADQAMVMLDGLPIDAVPAAHRDTLRGRIHISGGKWDLAKASLKRALASDPALSDAHYLLGQVHEHEGDWQRAAAEYRASRR